MKQFIFFSSFCLAALYSLAQSHSDHLFKITTYSGEHSYFSKIIDSNNCEGSGSVSSNLKYFFIIGDTCCQKGASWFKVVLDNQIVYLDKYYVREREAADKAAVGLNAYYKTLNDPIAFASVQISQFQNEEKRSLEEQERLEQIERERQDKEEKRQLDSLKGVMDKLMTVARAKNLVLYEWSWDYPNEYSSFASLHVIVLNPFKQKIKYVWVTVQAYNAVDDIVRDGFSGAAVKTVKGIGPIEYADKGSWDFEDVIYSKVIETMKITQIKIQFFDGTMKTFLKPKQIKSEEDDD